MLKLSSLFLLPVLAFAQLTPNSIIVTASRDAAARPDTVRFSVSISAATTATMDDVIAAAQGSGASAANFFDVSYYPTDEALPVTWTFSTTAPVSELKARIGLLTALQNSLAKDKKFDLSFYVEGSETSAQSQTCAMADLIADARAQAAKIASGAGLTVGAVQAIAGSVSGTTNPAVGIGSPSAVLTPACSLTVKFALTGAL
jgi:uncharacterized protein YggE